MLLTTALLIIAFFITYYSGYFMLSRIFYLLKAETENIHVSLCQLTGMAALAFIVSFLHLFWPINLSLSIPIYSCILCICFLYPKMFKEATLHLKNTIKQNFYLYIFLFAISIVSILARPGTGDIADYHLQAIKWAENYKNIIGLGNFNRPLANNNWWFNIQALLGNANHSVYVLNGLFFIVVFSFFLINKEENNSLKIFQYILAGFVAVSTKTAFVGSVTPDYAITLLIFICCYLYLKYSFDKNKNQLHVIIMLCLFAITIKLNSILILAIALLSFVKLIKQQNAKKYWLMYGAICTVSVGIWLIGNIIVSGWLCYPISNINLFDTDWKMPAEVLNMERFSIKQWGKIPFQDINITAQMSVQKWLPIWFNNLDFFNKILLLSCVLFFVLYIVYFITKKDKNAAILFLCIVSLSGVLFCFANGPHIRYAYGYMVVLLALNIATIFKERQILASKNLVGLLLFASFICVTPKLLFMYNNTVFSNTFFYPKPYPKNVFEEVNFNQQKLYISKQNSTCWDVFPCSYYMLNNCKLRDNNIENGFCVK